MLYFSRNEWNLTTTWINWWMYCAGHCPIFRTIIKLNAINIWYGTNEYHEKNLKVHLNKICQHLEFLHKFRVWNPCPIFRKIINLNAINIRKSTNEYISIIPSTKDSHKMAHFPAMLRSFNSMIINYNSQPTLHRSREDWSHDPDPNHQPILRSNI